MVGTRWAAVPILEGWSTGRFVGRAVRNREAAATVASPAAPDPSRPRWFPYGVTPYYGVFPTATRGWVHDDVPAIPAASTVIGTPSALRYITVVPAPD